MRVTDSLPPPAAATSAVITEPLTSCPLLLLLLPAVRPREQPIQPHLDAAPVEPSQHVASERMLRMLIEECAKREDSVIWVDPEGSMVVQTEVDPQ